jgi:hypothetical protein
MKGVEQEWLPSSGRRNDEVALVSRLYNFFITSEHRNLIYIECSLELVHILAAKTVALYSGAKLVLCRYLLHFF